MNQLINHIVRNGLLNPEELYETPFIDYHFMGVEGLYTESELGKLFEKITTVNTSVLV